MTDRYVLAWKRGSQWYLYAEERDYPDKPIIKRGFPSRKKASEFIESGGLTTQSNPRK